MYVDILSVHFLLCCISFFAKIVYWILVILCYSDTKVSSYVIHLGYLRKCIPRLSWVCKKLYHTYATFVLEYLRYPHQFHFMERCWSGSDWSRQFLRQFHITGDNQDGRQVDSSPCDSFSAQDWSYARWPCYSFSATGLNSGYSALHMTLTPNGNRPWNQVLQIIKVS